MNILDILLPKVTHNIFGALAGGLGLGLAGGLFGGGGGKTQQSSLAPGFLRRQQQFQANQARNLLFGQQVPIIGGPNPFLQQTAQNLQSQISADPFQTIAPQLQQAFQRASGQTQGQFARFGRSGSGLAQAATAEAGANAATPLIEAERQRQQQALFALPGIGAQIQAQQERELREPIERLALFSGLLPQNVGQVQQQQLHGNRLATGLGTGLLGLNVLQNLRGSGGGGNIVGGTPFSTAPIGLVPGGFNF